MREKNNLFHPNRFTEEFTPRNSLSTKTLKQISLSGSSLAGRSSNLGYILQEGNAAIYERSKATKSTMAVRSSILVAVHFLILVTEKCQIPWLVAGLLQFSPSSHICINCHLTSIPAMSLHNSSFSRVTTFVNMSTEFSFVWIFTSFNNC